MIMAPAVELLLALGVALELAEDLDLARILGLAVETELEEQVQNTGDMDTDFATDRLGEAGVDKDEVARGTAVVDGLGLDNYDCTVCSMHSDRTQRPKMKT